jgi:SH3-like domain-containing protein
MSRIACSRWLAVLMLGAGCRSGPPRASAIGEAYAGPAELRIRKEMAPDTPAVATVKHGERLEILQRRRRVVKVRTAAGREGWTDDVSLLRAEDIAALGELGRQAAGLPTQGMAAALQDTNVHSQPALQAPGFFQLKEGGKVEVLSRRLVRRVDLPRRPLITPPPKKAPAPKKPKATKEAQYPPPPLPRPPSPPTNWVDLSGGGAAGQPPRQTPVPAPDAPAPPLIDDWTLIRAASGQAGWVLTRRLMMAIPDEVAQYAEGHRITSYFALGTVEDRGQTRHHWVWTTDSGGAEDRDFDSVRVFVWSQRRHRYETTFIERRLRGYAPVRLEQVEYREQVYPGFCVCVEKKDGRRSLRRYAFLGGAVRLAGERPCQTQPLPLPAPSAAPATPDPLAAGSESWLRRVQRRLTAVTRGWFQRRSGP